MKEVKHLLRTAFVTALRGNVTYMGQVIPIDEAYENLTPASLQIGTAPPIEAYIIMRNQTVNDDSAKCGINQNSSFQLDIVTVFNANSGNSYHADMITNLVFAILMPNGGRRIQFSITDMSQWRGWLVSSMSPTEEDKDSKTFRNVLIFNFSISQ